MTTQQENTMRKTEPQAEQSAQTSIAAWLEQIPSPGEHYAGVIIGADSVAGERRRIMSWRLKRTAQCAKFPWRVDVDPHDIPNGYCETKHAGLADTIADPGSLRSTGKAMACHETDDAHCVGWVAHQIGHGNNIGLRIQMMTCENIGKLRLVGEQHVTFEDTLP